MGGIHGLPRLIAFAVTHENQTDGHEGRRGDEYQYAATEGLNHSSSGGCGLGVTQCATLGKSRHWREQNHCTQQHDAN